MNVATLDHMIIGIDEVGRGCLCGPVCAASVLVPEAFSQRQLLADSKALSAAQREFIAPYIRKECLWGIGWVYPHEIDRMNIHHASLTAMERAFIHMLDAQFSETRTRNSDTGHRFTESIKEGHSLKVLVDGKFLPNIPPHPHIDMDKIEVQAIIKGDSFVREIQAASILAKTARDFLMLLLDRAYPMLCLAKHKGYPTALHRACVSKYGTSPIYRHSFKIL